VADNSHLYFRPHTSDIKHPPSVFQSQKVLINCASFLRKNFLLFSALQFLNGFAERRNLQGHKM
jgi:hypothetical protein